MDIKTILNSALSPSRVNENIHYPLNFKQSISVVPIGQLSRFVNISEVFRNERNVSECYRIHGDINLVASNVLFNWSGDDSYENLIQLRDFDTDTEEYVLDLEDVLFEYNGWFYYRGGDNDCDRVFLEPKPNKFELNNTNWDISLRYPSDLDEFDVSFNGISLSEGIYIATGTNIVVDDRNMTLLVSSIRHNLNAGDTIEIISESGTIDGFYEVYRVGLVGGAFSSSIFVIDSLIFSDYPTEKFRFRKYINDIPSTYHTRSFKRFDISDNVEIYRSAFAKNIFSDEIMSFSFEDLNTQNVLDYSGAPLSEVYITFIKKVQGNPKFYTEVTSGLDVVVRESSYDINNYHTTSGIDMLELDVNPSLDKVFGDIIEYNSGVLQTYVLEETYHRYNTINREDNNFVEGYYYKAHQKIQIREYSQYIIESPSGNTLIPNYAVEDNNLFRWRELLDNDTSNSTNIPFVNGCHYMYNNIRHYVRRQNPCLDSQQVKFVVGVCDTSEQFEESTIENICE